MAQISLEQFIPRAQGFVFNPLPKLLHPLLVLLWAIQQADNNYRSLVEVIL